MDSMYSSETVMRSRDEDRIARRRSLSHTVLSLAVVLVAVSTCCGSQEPDDGRHPYFDRASGCTCDWESDPSLQIDGKRIPRSFSVSCQSPSREPIDGCDEFEFVLVPAQQVEVDGITLSVTRPFYISTTELTNAQYAALAGGFFDDGYKGYYGEQIFSAKQQFNVHGDDLSAIERHIKEPRHPKLTMDLEEASQQAATLSHYARVQVRIPTIGEWFAAMRGGAPTAYWCGDEVSPDLLAWGVNAPDPAEAMGHVREVREGPANPYGLYNVLGNAAELVYPDDEERALVRSHYGPTADRAASEQDTYPGYALPAYGTLAMGGGVRTCPGAWLRGDTAAFLEAFHQQTMTWRGILTETQSLGSNGWVNLGWDSGVRFVVEIPDSTRAGSPEGQ